ncbi:unnamed protein product, partial [Musa hybrid cultivar]
INVFIIFLSRGCWSCKSSDVHHARTWKVPQTEQIVEGLEVKDPDKLRATLRHASLSRCRS